jgi:WD40 repeat protein
MRRKLISLTLFALLCAATGYVAYIRIHPPEPTPPSVTDDSSPAANLDKQLRDLSNQLTRIKVVDPVARLPGHTDGLMAVAFSPDGKLLATGSGDNTVKLWRVSDFSLLRTFEAHQDLVFSLAFSPDSNTLVSADNSGAIILWNIPRLELLDRRIQPGRPTAVAFLPDNQHFLTISNGNLLRWSIASSDSATIHITGNLLSCLAISPQGEAAVGT